MLNKNHDERDLLKIEAGVDNNIKDAEEAEREA